MSADAEACAEQAAAPGLDWTCRWSQEARRRHPVRLQSVMNRFGSSSEVIGMHGGLPTASTFPLAGLDLHLADGHHLAISGPAAAAAQQYNLNTKVCCGSRGAATAGRPGAHQGALNRASPAGGQ